MAHIKDKFDNKKTKKDALETREAYIVANYGDPGLDTNYGCDILSRVVIIMFAPSTRVPCVQKYGNLFAVALRPRHLWISVSGSIPTSGGGVVTTSGLRRADYYGRIMVGDTSTSNTNAIPRIQPNYSFGEKITVSALAKPITLDNEVFYSAFTHSMYANGDAFSDTGYYNQGLPDTGYISPTHEDETRYKCATPNGGTRIYVPQFGSGTTPHPFTPTVNSYYFTLYRYQYELMQRMLITDASDRTDMLKLFTNSSYNAKARVDGFGGYLFNSQYEIDFTSIGWEEIAPSRNRSEAQDCNPLIVTTPNTFSTPRQRTHGTIVYNPTYNEVTL